MSKTREAKEFYREVVVCSYYAKKGLSKSWFLSPGLYKYKGKWIWVAKGDRAYLLKDISDMHLDNIIKALNDRHPDKLRKPLQWEKLKRKFIGNWHPDLRS